ncbi:O-antigen ligase family protein [Micromonospora sp. CA-259024]|uniref:O-antigen ligase family protein n=1 Tax=Micromonospora sp. CA-259024 TaxID=3239965 RepID=UPI003D90BE0F
MRARQLTGSLPSVLVLCLAAFMIARPPWWSFNYAAPVALAAIVLSGRLPRLRAADTLALLTGGWAYASLLWTDRTDLAAPAAYRYVSVCLLFVAVRHVLRGRRDLLLIGWTYLAGCAVVSIEVILGARTQGPVLVFDQRYGIEGINVNFTAYTLAAGVVLSLVLAVVASTGPTLLRFGPLALTLLLGSAVLLNGSRGATIGMLAGLTVVLFALLLPRLTVLTVGMLAAALIVLVPFGMAPERQLLWFDSLYGRPTGDISGRLAIWPYALTTWSEAPLTGSGAGVFINTNPFEMGPHNLLLTVGNDLGLVGVLLYFGTIAVALIAAARTSRAGLLLIGAFTATMTPIWLTGQWETSLAMWLVLALVTVSPEVNNPRRGRHARANHRASGLLQSPLFTVSPTGVPSLGHTGRRRAF